MVTVAIPYLFSAMRSAELPGVPAPPGARLAARPRPGDGAAAVLFSMWVTFAAGYQAVYEAMVVLVPASSCTPSSRRAVPAHRSRPGGGRNRHGRRRPKGRIMSFNVQSEVGQLRQVIVHRPGLELSRLTPSNIGGLAVRRRDVGQESEGRTRRVRRGAPRSRESGCTTSGSCWPRHWSCPKAGPSSWTGCARPEMLGPNLVTPAASAL